MGPARQLTKVLSIASRHNEVTLTKPRGVKEWCPLIPFEMPLLWHFCPSRCPFGRKMGRTSPLHQSSLHISEHSQQKIPQLEIANHHRTVHQLHSTCLVPWHTKLLQGIQSRSIYNAKGGFSKDRHVMSFSPLESKPGMLLEVSSSRRAFYACHGA